MQLIRSATEADMVRAFSQRDPRWATRGFPDRGIFTGFPLEDCKWEYVTLAPDELLAVRHIRSEPAWRLIAGPERDPQTAVRWVHDHPHDETAAKIRTLHARLVAGEDIGPIILAAAPGDDLVVLEGNKRTVAAAMGDVPTARLEFLLGTSPMMGQWHFYKDRPGSF
jgi:hypothetical protein